MLAHLVTASLNTQGASEEMSASENLLQRRMSYENHRLTEAVTLGRLSL